MQFKGRSHIKPGSMLKSRIPMRTWADHDENMPGFVEIDLVGHEGGNPRGHFCFTLTVTDIATGWTENRTVRNKAQKHLFAALTDVVEDLPFPILGIESDNGSEFINDQLLRYGLDNELKFTRVAVGQQERRRPRGAEEQDHGTTTGRVPALRHRGGTVAAQQDLASAGVDRRPFLPAGEADLQGLRGCEGQQEVRHRDDTLCAGDRPSGGEGATETQADQHTRIV
ncbi:hypothetical protein ACQP1G_16650 [Nocardia sp. CA-107356]|uniref:hypothetical protein n=1 Tax=Nocardia sp. CA-107356 TaxID=3239972 RepID=UPI003D93CC07